jgi:serine/threonine protein kinase
MPAMLAPDQHLGPYRLIARVGAGGMGEVWRAEDTRLGRTVAIKVLPPSVIADVEAIARLKREARTAAQLYHPSIATIHSIEQDGDHIFIVEEFVEGESLTQVIKRGGLSESEICRIARAVADALAEAHAKGIVHRDIKPDNIIVAGNRVKVLDFGIAKQVGVVGAPSSETPTAFVTQQGMILGTIHYMSPEQALGKTIDGRTDVFSLGVVLYEMATGRRPFGGETITETMMRIIRDEPAEPVLVNPGISPGMNEIIQRCLRKNAAERFTAAELVTALDAQMGRAKTAPYTNVAANAATAAAPTVLTGSQLKTVQEPPPRRRSAVPAVIILLVIAIAAAAAVIATRSPKPKPMPQTMTPPKPQPGVSSTMLVTAPPAVIEEQKPVVPTAKPTTTHAAETTPVRPPTTTTQYVAPPVPEPAPAPAPVPQPASEPRAEALYATAISQLAGGDWMEARKTLHRVLKQDPHYAKAHFRMGEIALLNRNLVPASEELNRALADSDRLDTREQQLARIGLALAERNRPEIQRLAADIWQQWPDDPDLTRMRETFPGMFLELPRERRRRRP